MSNTKKIAKKASTAAAFKKAKGPVELPSGLYMELKRPGLLALAKDGLIPNSLMGIVDAGIKAGKAPEPEEILGTGGVDIAAMEDMVNNIIVAVAVDPEVLPLIDPETQEPWEERDDDQVYVDDLEETDKMFIFQYSTGGTRDLEQFRRESADLLAPVLGQQVVGGKTKSVVVPGR